MSNTLAYLNLFIFFMCLLTLKLLNDILVLGLSCKWIQNEKKSKLDELKLESSKVQLCLTQTPLPTPPRHQVDNLNINDNDDYFDDDDQNSKILKKKTKKRSSLLITRLKCKRLLILTTTKQFNISKQKKTKFN